MSAWKYNNKDFTIDDIKDNVGFVYIITNMLTKKQYIGKKTFYFSRTKIINGKKKHIKVLSDWETYWGSNKILKEEVNNNDENYMREILYLCKSKSDASYLETYEIFKRNALISDNFYNDWVTCKISRLHLQRHIKKINDDIKKFHCMK